MFLRSDKIRLLKNSLLCSTGIKLMFSFLISQADCRRRGGVGSSQLRLFDAVAWKNGTDIN